MMQKVKYALAFVAGAGYLKLWQIAISGWEIRGESKLVGSSIYVLFFATLAIGVLTFIALSEHWND